MAALTFKNCCEPKETETETEIESTENLLQQSLVEATIFVL